jgi:hypothetical protein
VLAHAAAHKVSAQRGHKFAIPRYKRGSFKRGILSMNRRPLLAALGLCLAFTTLPALAQMPPTRIRGKIAALDGSLLTVTSRDGATLKITLDEKVTVGALKRVELSSITPNTYVGIAAITGPDGLPQAVEVLVFPEAARGSGEGHYPWDLAPNTTMTNATVQASVQANAGRELSLAYKGGTIAIKVPADVPIVTPYPAERADLKPGMAVFLAATKAEDGSFKAARVTVEKDGVAPPM